MGSKTIATILAVLIIDAKRFGIIEPADISLKAIPNIFLQDWAQRQYWYIPFVTALPLISPWLTRIGNRTLAWLSVVPFALTVSFPYRPSSHHVANKFRSVRIALFSSLATYSFTLFLSRSFVGS